MPPRRAVAATTATTTAVAAKSRTTTTTSKKKSTAVVATKSQSRKKRTRGARDSDKKEEDEGDENEEVETEEKTNDEGEESEAESKGQPKKKTKREPKTTTAVDAASSSSFSSYASPASRCDTDSLSLIFSYLTSKEFSSCSVIDRQWLNASRLSTSWPQHFHLDSAISEFRFHNSFYPNEVVPKDQHRCIRVNSRDDLSSSLIQKSPLLCKNLTSLQLPTSSEDPTQPQSLTHFPHLTSLIYSGSNRDLLVSLAEIDSTTTIAQSIRSLRINHQPSWRYTPLPLVRRSIPFKSLRCLILQQCEGFAPESLLDLHQLEYFRFVREDSFHVRLARVLRYLSVKGALRSVAILSDDGTRKGNQLRMQELLCTLSVLSSTPWKETLNRVDKAEQQFDAIPQDDSTEDLPTAQLHEFETNEPLTYEALWTVCRMPLTRLVCQMNFELKYTFDGPIPTLNPNAFPESLSTGLPQHLIERLSQLHHLDIDFGSSSYCDREPRSKLMSLSLCTQLRSLRIGLYDIMCLDFSGVFERLTRLEDLAINFGDRQFVLPIDAASWTSLRLLRSLRRLELALLTNHSFPLDVIAKSLSQLPEFVRLDLRLHRLSSFLIPISFWSAVAVSSSWRSLHFSSSNIYGTLTETTNADLKKLSPEVLASPAIKRFRVYHHCLKSQSRSGWSWSRTELICTQYRIGVKPTKTAAQAMKIQPPWWIVVPLGEE